MKSIPLESYSLELLPDIRKMDAKQAKTKEMYFTPRESVTGHAIIEFLNIKF